MVVGRGLAAWMQETKTLARIVFGLLLFRSGMEQVLGFPEPSGLSWVSLDGFVRLLSFPGGLLLMLGLLTRPAALVLSILYGARWFVGPLQAYFRGAPLFGQGGSSDAVLLNAFFFLYLGLTGAGIWSTDRFRSPAGVGHESQWAPYALAALRIVAGFLFIQHGIPKLFGPELPPIASTRFVAGVLECVGGPSLMLGFFTRPVAFVLSGQMAVAYFMVHAPRGFWGSFATPGMESAVLNCFVFLFLSTAGPGAWSLDALWLRGRGPHNSTVGQIHST